MPTAVPCKLKTGVLTTCSTMLPVVAILRGKASGTTAMSKLLLLVRQSLPGRAVLR